MERTFAPAPSLHTLQVAAIIQVHQERNEQANPGAEPGVERYQNDEWRHPVDRPGLQPSLRRALALAPPTGRQSRPGARSVLAAAWPSPTRGFRRCGMPDQPWREEGRCGATWAK